jgi:hypothetical protein
MKALQHLQLLHYLSKQSKFLRVGKLASLQGWPGWCVVSMIGKDAGYQVP